MNKVINKLKFNKKFKNKHPYHNDLPDHLNGEIVVLRDQQGMLTVKEDNLFRLCLNDDELEYTGWNVVKQNLIDMNIITQVDIDNEKAGFAIRQKLQTFRTDIQADPKAKAWLDTIRVGMGLPPL